MVDALLVVLGNQLFRPELLSACRRIPVFMAEDRGLCTHFKYHKHKLILFLAAMRAHARELRKAGHSVNYQELTAHNQHLTYEEKLDRAVRENNVRRLVSFEVEDHFFEERLTRFCRERQVEWTVLPTPMFLTPRRDFAGYLGGVRRPFMKSFYEWQRRRLDILMDSSKRPIGGRYSFDTENRKPLPRDLMGSAPPRKPMSAIEQDVARLVDELLPDHPGDSEGFWLPTTRRGALVWLDRFLGDRLALFGPYEDALTDRSDFVYHSVLSPLINLGLLTPREVIDAALDHARGADVPLESLEGFVRQVIGWREFVRGVYHHYDATEQRRNFWGHRRRLSPAWYAGSTGIPVLDEAVRKVGRLGWCHHIERLMVISNLMLLCQVHPREVHRWFMEMFVDSSDWVMGPNVYGMGQFSDGGLFATKPYLCGSNYYLKMGRLARGPWCDVVDGLYWSFVEKHRSYFQRNPRTSSMPLALDRMAGERKERLFRLARDFRQRVTVSPREAAGGS